MSEHSILPPSSAARRVACPGSRALEALYPHEATESSLEGDAAHKYAADWLKIYTMKKEGFEYDPFIPEEMIEGAQLYYDAVMDIVKEDWENLHIEERIDISIIHPECWGTCDAWYFDGKTLHVWDYKYGFAYVDAYENWQLISYAVGILKKLIEKQVMPEYIMLTIVQPRSYQSSEKIRSWEMQTHRFLDYMTLLQKSEAKAMQPNAPCYTSSECSNCSARFACPILQNESLKIVDQLQLKAPHELPPPVLGKELKLLKEAADLLYARITGLEQQATSLIKKGKRIPHFHLEKTTPRERWSKDIGEIIALGEIFGIDLTKKESSLITPKQAVKEGIPEDIVKAYSERPKGSLKLTKDDPKQLRKIFGDSK